jgi:hypothetical protein
MLGAALDKLDPAVQVFLLDGAEAGLQHQMANIEPYDSAIVVVGNLHGDTGRTGTYVKHKVSRPKGHSRDQELAPAKVLKGSQHLRPGVVRGGNPIEEVLGEGSLYGDRRSGFRQRGCSVLAFICLHSLSSIELFSVYAISRN